MAARRRSPRRNPPVVVTLDRLAAMRRRDLLLVVTLAVAMPRLVDLLLRLTPVLHPLVDPRLQAVTPQALVEFLPLIPQQALRLVIQSRL
jgi:hypothetical protein